VYPRTGYDFEDGAALIDAELVAAGATVVQEHSFGDVLDHIVMQDPEGNEFCVASRPGA
jgi:predicted enzyme related to lactoylglutathione lyase